MTSSKITSAFRGSRKADRNYRIAASNRLWACAAEPEVVIASDELGCVCLADLNTECLFHVIAGGPKESAVAVNVDLLSSPNQ